MGSIQNLVAASIPRSPAALGLHFKKDTLKIKGRRVAQVLREAEEKHGLLGTALLDVFFPGSLRVRREDTDDFNFWTKALKERYDENKHGVRLDRLVPGAVQHGNPVAEGQGGPDPHPALRGYHGRVE